MSPVAIGAACCMARDVLLVLLHVHGSRIPQPLSLFDTLEVR